VGAERVNYQRIKRSLGRVGLTATDLRARGIILKGGSGPGTQRLPYTLGSIAIRP